MILNRFALLAAALLATSLPLTAQQLEPPATRWQSPSVTDNPNPGNELAALRGLEMPSSLTDQDKPAQTPAKQDAAATAPEKDQREKAEEQVKAQEKQRVLGVLPSFNVSYRDDAVSLTAKQKIKLAMRTNIDPVTFGVAFLAAGYKEALHDDTGFGWGPKGYFKRVGAGYLDTFDGNLIGNGLLPALLHQDPRYFRLGHGSTTHRLLYAAAASFICKHDNTGKWEPNYSNVGGNIIAGAISTLYYPKSDSGVGLTISNGFLVTAEGAVGAVFQEFWPDISRKFFHKDPTNGLDAEKRAADADKTKKRKHQE